MTSAHRMIRWMILIGLSTTTTKWTLTMLTTMTVMTNSIMLVNAYWEPGSITCGCPRKCTQEKLEERGGTIFPCGDRISYFINHYGNPEANACEGASKHPDLSDEENDKRPCPEECHPDICHSSLNRDPNAGKELDCGCPETCTPEVLDATMREKPFSCRARIAYFRMHHKVIEYAACKAASEQDYCDFDKCNPEKCGSTLPTEPFDEGTVYYGPTKEEIAKDVGIGFAIVILLVILGPTAYMYYRGRMQRRKRENNGESDGIYKDDVELSQSAYSDEASLSSSSRRSSHAPPASAFQMDDNVVDVDIDDDDDNDLKLT